MSKTEKQQNLNHTITFEQKVNFIKGISIFKHLKEVDWVMIANGCEVIEIARNEIVYKEGEDINYFFLIIDGSVVAKKEGSTSEQDKTFTNGEFFGLTPFFFGGKAKATITTTRRSLCLYMMKQSIEEIIVPILRDIERISQSYGDFINCL